MIFIQDHCENTNGALVKSGMLSFDREIFGLLLSSVLVAYSRFEPILKFLVFFSLSDKVEA